MSDSSKPSRTTCSAGFLPGDSDSLVELSAKHVTGKRDDKLSPWVDGDMDACDLETCAHRFRQPPERHTETLGLRSGGGASRFPRGHLPTRLHNQTSRNLHTSTTTTGHLTSTITCTRPDPSFDLLAQPVHDPTRSSDLVRPRKFPCSDPSVQSGPSDRNEFKHILDSQQP